MNTVTMKKCFKILFYIKDMRAIDYTADVLVEIIKKQNSKAKEKEFIIIDEAYKKEIGDILNKSPNGITNRIADLSKNKILIQSGKTRGNYVFNDLIVDIIKENKNINMNLYIKKDGVTVRINKNNQK